MPSAVEPIKSFTDLYAWQEGHKLAIQIYTTTQLFPKEELYSLVNQMRRAALSVTSNIAEGFGRQSYKEKIQFYYIAQGSLTELENQLLLARDIKYLRSTEFQLLEQQAIVAHRLLIGLIRKSKEILKS